MSNSTNVLPKRIPYGVADYGRLRRENAYYVDKTHYIPSIEAAPFYLFCIRPRRFGKSLWLSVLQHYYDVNQADNFELLFGETYTAPICPRCTHCRGGKTGDAKKVSVDLQRLGIGIRG